MSTAAILDSIEHLQAAVVDFLKLADGGDFGILSDDEFIDAAREIEAIRRQPDTADHAVVAEVRARDLPGKHVARTARGFLGQLWRITPLEAGARVREADNFSPRVTRRVRDWLEAVGNRGSGPGSTAAGPTSTTSSCSALTTMPGTWSKTGASTSATQCPGSSHPH
jgi:hypothetical protein